MVDKDSGPESTATKEKLKFSDDTMAEFEALVKRYPERRAALLPTLRLIERDFACISEDGMVLAAELIGVSPAYVLGVVSFYTHYKGPKDGKYVIELCRTLPCALRGADKLAEHACKKLGLGIGESSEDGKFTIKSVECIAACGYGPAMQINGAYHEHLTFKKFDEIVDKLV
jgi:NADH-quinone oxidoreductase subunit E